MEVYRVDITSWTGSFRYPNLISGVQPTLEVPPLSTVLGLINAAAGQYLVHQNLQIGYYFKFASKEVDLETIYQISNDSKGNPSNVAKSNVIKREFLFEPELSIYLNDEELLNYLANPYYNLLLGRSNDLATIKRIEKVELESIGKAEKVKGQIIPLERGFLPGKIQALPIYFSNSFPRLNLGTQPFSIISHYAKDIKTNFSAFRDLSKGKSGVDIFFHNVNTAIYD